MDSLSTRSLRDSQAKTPLLSSGPDGSYMPSEAQCEFDIPLESSPATSSYGSQKSSIPRVLNLEFGSAKSPLLPERRLQADIDPRIREAFEDLKSKRAVYHSRKLVYDTVIDEIDGLARQYNEEQEKAPTYPPKGTWFHAERKQFDRKKAEHKEKLRFIIRLRQAIIDNDEPKERVQLSKARDAVTDAQTKLDRLRRERKTSDA